MNKKPNPENVSKKYRIREGYILSEIVSSGKKEPALKADPEKLKTKLYAEKEIKTNSERKDTMLTEKDFNIFKQAFEIESKTGIPVILTYSFFASEDYRIPYSLFEIYKSYLDEETIQMFIRNGKTDDYLPDDMFDTQAELVTANEFIQVDSSLSSYDLNKGDVILINPDIKEPDGFVVFKIGNQPLLAHASMHEDTDCLKLVFAGENYPLEIYWDKKYLDKLEIIGAYAGAKKND